MEKDNHESKIAFQVAELFCNDTLLRFIREKVKELEEEKYVIANTVENETSITQDNPVIEISFPEISTNKLACKYCKKIFERHDLVRTHVRAKNCQTQNQSMEGNSEIEEIIFDDVSIVKEVN